MAISTLSPSFCAFVFSLLYFFTLTSKAVLFLEMQAKNYSNSVCFRASLYGLIISYQDSISRLAKAGAHYAFTSKTKEIPFLISSEAVFQFLPHNVFLVHV